MGIQGSLIQESLIETNKLTVTVDYRVRSSIGRFHLLKIAVYDSFCI